MTTTSRVGFCEIGKLPVFSLALGPLYNFFALLFEYDAHFALLLLRPGERVHARGGGGGGGEGS